MFCRGHFIFPFLTVVLLVALPAADTHADGDERRLHRVSDGDSATSELGDGHALSERSRKALKEMLNRIAPELDVDIVPVPPRKDGSASRQKPSPVMPAKPAFQLADTLNGLFTQLRRTSDRRRAKRIEKRIRALWLTSDSRSIDLLTHWARNASAEHNYAMALDLLDQVVTQRPNYAEGWNQRATLHYTTRAFAKSLADIERTLALEPRHFGAIAGLATILERLERKEEALAAWYRALAVYPAMERGQAAVLRLEEELAGRGI